MSSVPAIHATAAPLPVAEPPRAFRIVPVPRSEPPSDDERRAAGLDVAPPGAQLLPMELPHRAPPRPPRRTSPRPPGPALGNAGRPPDGAHRTSDAPGPADPAGRGGAVKNRAAPVRIAIRGFLATCVEVMGGFRPPAQLRPLCLPDRFEDIAAHLSGRSSPFTQSATRQRAFAYPRSPAPVGPPRVGRAHQPGPADRIAIRRVQVCEPLADVAEVAVVLARREKAWALALRLELHRGRWLCSHLEVI